MNVTYINSPAPRRMLYKESVEHLAYLIRGSRKAAHI